MNKKENTENIAVGLSTAAGSLLGTAGTNAAISQIKEPEVSIDEDVVAQHVESHDEVVVVSHSNDNVQENVIEQTTHEPVPAPDPEPDSVVVYPEPNFIIEDVYAGPYPEPEPINPDIDPINCMYGPPEPNPFPDIDVPKRRKKGCLISTLIMLGIIITGVVVYNIVQTHKVAKQTYYNELGGYAFELIEPNQGANHYGEVEHYKFFSNGTGFYMFESWHDVQNCYELGCDLEARCDTATFSYEVKGNTIYFNRDFTTGLFSADSPIEIIINIT